MNAVPKGNTMEFCKLKAIADYKIYIAELVKSLIGRVKNTVVLGNASY